MTLDYRRESLDGLTDAEKSHYTQKDGMFYLSINDEGDTRTQGLIVSKNQALAEKKALEAKLKAYDGIDPEDARNGIARIASLSEELKQAKASGKSAADIEQIKRDLKTEYDKQLAEKESTIANLQNTFKTQTKDEVIKAALRKNGVREQAVDIVSSYLHSRVDVVEGDTGGYSVRIKKSNGDGFEVSTKDGSVFKTVEELVSDMKEDKSFSFVFDGTKASGSGADAGAPGTAPKSSGFSGKWSDVRYRSDLVSTKEKIDFIAYLKDKHGGDEQAAQDAFFALPEQRPPGI